MNRCTLVTNFNYGIYLFSCFRTQFSFVVEHVYQTVFTPPKKGLKNCATISKVYSWIQTTLSPQTGHGCLTTWYTTCWYKTSCTTSYPWNLVEKKGDIVSTYQYAFIAEIFYQYVSPTIYHQKHTSTNHAMPYGSGKKKNYDDNPSIPVIIIPARSGQRVQPSNRPSNSSWPPKVLHRFEAGDLDFHVVFFFREGKKPNQQKSNEKSNG